MKHAFIAIVLTLCGLGCASEDTTHDVRYELVGEYWGTSTVSLYTGETLFSVTDTRLDVMLGYGDLVFLDMGEGCTIPTELENNCALGFACARQLGSGPISCYLPSGSQEYTNTLVIFDGVDRAVVMSDLVWTGGDGTRVDAQMSFDGRKAP